MLNTPLDDRDAGLCEIDGTIYLTSFNNSFATQRYYSKNFSHFTHLHYTPENIAFDEEYMATVTKEQKQKYLGAMICKSTDNGHTFSKPKIVPIMTPHGLIKLKDGSALFIGKAFSDMEKSQHEYLSDTKSIYAMKVYPDLTFDTPYVIAPKIDLRYEEPHAIDLGDKILMGIRVEGDGRFTIFHSYSTDGGKTFSEPKPTGFDGSPPHYFKHSSGAVILSYSRRKPPFPTVVRVSLDNGLTFGEEIIIRPSSPSVDGPDYCDLGYPSTTENNNGELITVHTKRLTTKRQRKFNILFGHLKNNLF